MWINDDFPPRGAYVLGRANSGYIGHPYRYFTCRYDYECQCWRDVSNDRITDYGEEIKEWRHFGDLETVKTEGLKNA